MTEMQPELQHDNPPKAVSSVETPETPGVGYAYVDQSKEFEMVDPTTTEATHAMLNPAYYPKDLKPEAQWNEGEKEGADNPRDPSFPSAPDTNEELELPESMQPEAVEARTKEYEEMAQQDLKAAQEKGEELQPAGGPDSAEAEEGSVDPATGAPKSKVGRKPKS